MQMRWPFYKKLCQTGGRSASAHTLICTLAWKYYQNLQETGIMIEQKHLILLSSGIVHGYIPRTLNSRQCSQLNLVSLSQCESLLKLNS